MTPTQIALLLNLALFIGPLAVMGWNHVRGN